MKRSALPPLLAAAVFIVVALAFPLSELFYNCREPESEGCVWGKALLPLSLAAWAIIGLIAATASFFVARMIQRRRAQRP